MGRAKGQILVFEQVLLFFLGFMIFIACFVIFSTYQGSFINAGNEDQLRQIADYVAYAIVKSSEGWNSTESYVSMELPRSIGGEAYRLRLSAGGLNITMLPSMKSSFTALYGINRSVGLQDSEALSSSGRVVLYKNGNNIRLE